MSDFIKKKEKKKEGIGPLGRGMSKKKPVLIMLDDKFITDPKKLLEEVLMSSPEKSDTKFSKGGRAGFKAGSKGCKLAKKGRGRAYGKNS